MNIKCSQCISKNDKHVLTSTFLADRLHSNFQKRTTSFSGQKSATSSGWWMSHPSQRFFRVAQKSTSSTETNQHWTSDHICNFSKHLPFVSYYCGWLRKILHQAGELLGTMKGTYETLQKFHGIILGKPNKPTGAGFRSSIHSTSPSPDISQAVFDHQGMMN